ncbi:MAG TPA: M1 family metallopeptidase [Ferruginibacter sp.]|jgi:aminopeptidase N|nr:M1 family metallopeptidase [Ferruginibacter sp.]HQW61335.1 M1 family metallopeptidase [Ferruginibacter sp.]HRB56026.1 M1 family metallopeptidase [Ferruginibacter sp.]
MKYFFFLILFCCFLNSKTFAQVLSKPHQFTHQDTLRGSIGPGRLGWDVLHYNITVKPDFETKTIFGKNCITYFDNGVKLMQIDLQQPLEIDSIVHQKKSLPFTRDGNAFFTQIRDSSAMYKIKPGNDSVTVYYHGKPREAKMPPWDGGWIWKKDRMGRPWMSVACQGLGASVWYPCKDHQSDEPDNGAVLNITVPDSLKAVGNGRLMQQSAHYNSSTTYSWQVVNPINNYNIVPYIGKYVHFGEQYNGLKGKLDMDYWVLDYDMDSAKKQFVQAPEMMKAFEYWFGPYPFYEDGYKLVQSPHLGMEHQSAIAYGNRFKNGYLGRDLSGTGWGLKWDFIIIHESGHEWFANNITTADIADMWVHEGFTNYSETLFTGYYYGTQAGNEYNIGSRKGIQNDISIIGAYGVNSEGSGDMYPKASAMIHMIRQIMKNDKKFRKLLMSLNKDFYHKIVTSAQIENYISQFAKKDFSIIYDQYLRTIQVPVLEYKLQNNLLHYRYQNCVAGFNMPLKIKNSNGWLKPTEEWQTKKYKKREFAVDENFYINTTNASN